MKKVLVIKSDVLPYSETFIREQMSACVRWQPILIGERYVPGVSLDGLKTSLIRAHPLASKIANYLNVPYWGHARALHAERADLIHVHFGTEAVKFWPLLRKLNLPVIVTLHGSDINIHPEWWKKHGGMIGRKYPGRLLNMAKDERVHFVAVSEAVKQRALDFGLAADRIQVRYIGVDTAKFAPSGKAASHRRRRVLYVGRLIEKKGARYLIEAFERVCEEVVGAELVMIGDGPLSDELKRFAASLPVLFLGKRSSDEVRRQIEESRVVCLPSVIADNGDAEGLPIVILEAQAAGVPVVTSALGGALEGIIHGTTGFATPARDPAALAEALIRILNDDSMSQAMAVAARAFITEHFDLGRCTARLEQYYDEVSGVV